MGYQHRKVDRALRMVDGGMTPYAAATKAKIALSTIYRALARRRRQAEERDPVGAALDRLAKLRQK